MTRKEQRSQSILSKGKKLHSKALESDLKNDLESAEKLYRDAIQIGYLHCGIFSNLGVICQNSGRIDEAIDLYNQAIKIDNNYFHAYINLGSIYKERGNLDLALKYTLKSLEIRPENNDALRNLGAIYRDRGDLNAALESTLKCIKLQKDNPESLMNLGIIYKEIGNFDQAITAALRALELEPDNPVTLMNLGSIYKDVGNLSLARFYTLKSLEIRPGYSDALMNIGGIHKDLGELEKALSYTLQSINLQPDNANAYMNLAIVYKELGKFDDAINSIDQSLKLKPDDSQTICNLGRIQMALGRSQEAKKTLLKAIEINRKEYEAYYALSLMIETKEDAETIVNLAKSIKSKNLTPINTLFIEFALANSFHKLKKQDTAAKHLRIANDAKLLLYPSNASQILNAIASNLSEVDSLTEDTKSINIGKDRIFIIGMPRSGSTLLATILSMSPEIKDLGESLSLERAINKSMVENNKFKSLQKLNEDYSRMEPNEDPRFKFTVDKNLYNFIFTGIIATYLPSSKIIHCRRNPMDNILSMYRSNLQAGNNYTSNIEDSAKLFVAHEQAMQIYKEKFPDRILTFDYDRFVNDPKKYIANLFDWLQIEFDANYIRPEDNKNYIITASIIQARRPITNKSVGGWKNYKNLLKPAYTILKQAGLMEGYDHS